MSAVVDLGRIEAAAAGAATRASVLVIGAGPAGLAVSACLKAAGLEPLILEQSSQVAVTWRHHYARLHLHTCRAHSSLPLLPLPEDLPTFPSKDQVVSYLEDYASHFDLRPSFDTRVKKLRWRDGQWCASTSRGLFFAPQLVVATGYNRVPRRPAFPGLSSFPGPAPHSSEYSTGRDFAGQRVLVIGCGNSGAEIALDLVEQGAHPDLVVRSPIHVTPREVLGTPTQTTNIRLSVLPVPVADFLAGAVLRWTMGDLSEWGIERPREGPNAQIWKYGRVPLIDVGTIERIKDGSIGVRPGVELIEGNRVRFADGSEDHYDSLVLATGFVTGLSSLLEDESGLLNDRGQPHVFGAEAAEGLYFIGYRNPPTGALREISIEAPTVAKAIAQKVGIRGRKG